MDPDAPEDQELKPAASFRGRLDLERFRHNKPEEPRPSPNPSPRRSPRHVTARPSEKTTFPSRPISQSPLKRKAPPPSSTPSSPAPPSPSTSSSTSKTTTNTTTGTTKRRRPKGSTYQPPSVYAHLPPLPDALAPNLHILFVGLNPGIQTATTGHAYAHPSNLFWKLLHSSGLTPDRVVPATEDRTLPSRYGLGFTNIVSRPSRNGAELSKAEMDAGVAALEEKARAWRPEVMCIVGKSIWESIFRVRRGRGLRKGEFGYGWQGEGENMGLVKESGGEGAGGAAAAENSDDGDGEEQKEQEQEEWAGAKVFVATSTSGLAATLSPAEKQAIWNELGEWCTRRRREKKVVEEG